MRLVLAAGTLLAGAAAVQPPRLTHVPVQPPDPHAVGWMATIGIARIDLQGRVSAFAALRDDLQLEAGLGRWRFEPATMNKEPVEAPILVAALYRPPEMIGPAPPPDLADLARRLDEAVPVPVSAPAPPYPPRARGDGVVVLEVTVGDRGRPAAARVVRSSPAFAGAAIDTARSWRFKPAMRNGRPARSIAVVIFGFRAPVHTPARTGPSMRGIQLTPSLTLLATGSAHGFTGLPHRPGVSRDRTVRDSSSGTPRGRPTGAGEGAGPAAGTPPGV